MKLKNNMLLVIVIFILSGCNTPSSSSNSPEGISDEYYKMFIESYELYEERVQEYNGRFVDSNGEIIDFSEKGVFTDPILEVAWEDRKRKENGEKGVLTEKEDQLISDFMSLYFIKQLDSMNEELKQTVIGNQLEYSDPLKAAIDLEKKVMKTLEIKRDSVTAGLESEAKEDNKVVSSEDAKEELIEEQEVYQDEPEKETYEQSQETVDKVHQYIVNVVNDLTIVENMSSDMQSAYTYSRIYGNDYLDYTKQFNNSIETMERALIDLTEQKAPRNTEYFVLEPALKQYVNEYQNVINDIKISKSNNSGNTIDESIQALKNLDTEIKNIESSLAISIIANNYFEYDALLYMWNKGENYQTGDDTHVTIPSGIKTEFFRNGIDFAQDLSQY
ncbi:hypothetical protein [Cytobacillus kochii]|uniref:DUF3829 domain-containing protein n=1 Tax=Cytobacillus kochii TaxID=859143 RepID=A0A248TPU0_9BACI|nr:hypothetical protein [Cytobacillus kochii]ASV70244.1 hypothetical protein CKF48_23485 [Cytobacillus kochii]